VAVITVTGSNTEAAAAGKCGRGKPGTSENKDNCKNNYGIAQH
jgi:hypothetical protein